MVDFTDQDLDLLESKGISKKKVLNQIATFKEGIPFVQLEKPAVISDGIIAFTREEENKLVRLFEDKVQSLSLLKFVPASGAASRMFKTLFNFLEDYKPENEDIETYLGRKEDKLLTEFFHNHKELPFYHLVADKFGLEDTTTGDGFYRFVDKTLAEDAMNFGFYPKGLLPFHRYRDHVATPFEEHLKEAYAYASNDGNAQLHFTISPQHKDMFREEYKTASERVGNTCECTFDVSYSYQRPATDTVAVTPDNEPFRNTDGSLLFRPGGHGALIENLDEQEADIIFIKNIDNVTTPAQFDMVVHSKKILAGHLIAVQEKAFAYAAKLEDNNIHGDELLAIKTFLEEELNVRFLPKFWDFSVGEQIEILKDKISRPIRVCGMVKNQGEPGGGPYWVRDHHGHISLQIVESAQVDTGDEQQLTIFKRATHFNPVDLVCGVKNHKGEKYPLMNYLDSKQGFITDKTQEGRPLKALELPGLWNGAMAFWNTIFVEVPLETFNPVKTVNDLLRPAHQVQL